jgi:DNA-binding NtrC family response regulator
MIMKILSVARDPQLAEARESALREAGFQVSSARDFRELKDLCSKSRFDLAIIGQSFEPEVKRAVAAILAECNPKPEILEIYIGRPTLKNTTAVLESVDPQDLIRQVKELMKKIRRRSA